MGQIDLTYQGQDFDSTEEVLVAMWLQELKNTGFVANWRKCKTSIDVTYGLKVKYEKVTQLKTKVKTELKEHTLLKPSEYTPDFEVKFTDAGVSIFVSGIWSYFDKNKTFFAVNPLSVILLEVKPGFDQNNMTRTFVNNQKFIWDKHQLFVNLVEPETLFKQTFLPLEAVPHFKYQKPPKGKKVGDWKLSYTPRDLHEFIKNHTDGIQSHNSR